MPEVIRFGILGTGMIGREHIRNSEAVPGGRAVAIADPYGPSVEAALAASLALESHSDLDGLLVRLRDAVGR